MFSIKRPSNQVSQLPYKVHEWAALNSGTELPCSPGAGSGKPRPVPRVPRPGPCLVPSSPWSAASWAVERLLRRQPQRCVSLSPGSASAAGGLASVCWARLFLRGSWARGARAAGSSRTRCVCKAPRPTRPRFTGTAAKPGRAGAFPAVNHPAHAQHAAHLTAGVRAPHRAVLTRVGVL